MPYSAIPLHSLKLSLILHMTVNFSPVLEDELFQIVFFSCINIAFFSDCNGEKKAWASAINIFSNKFTTSLPGERGYTIILPIGKNMISLGNPICSLGQNKNNTMTNRYTYSSLANGTHVICSPTSTNLSYWNIRIIIPGNTVTCNLVLSKISWNDTKESISTIEKQTQKNVVEELLDHPHTIKRGIILHWALCMMKMICYEIKITDYDLSVTWSLVSSTGWPESQSSRNYINMRTAVKCNCLFCVKMYPKNCSQITLNYIICNYMISQIKRLQPFLLAKFLGWPSSDQEIHISYPAGPFLPPTNHCIQ